MTSLAKTGGGVFFNLFRTATESEHDCPDTILNSEAFISSGLQCPWIMVFLLGMSPLILSKISLNSDAIFLSLFLCVKRSRNSSTLASNIIRSVKTRPVFSSKPHNSQIKISTHSSRREASTANSLQLFRSQNFF